MTEYPDELELLTALANRLIPGATPWGQFAKETVIRPGRPAPELPPDVPLPPDSRVIGSYTSGSFSMTLLDADQDAREVARLYRQALEAGGWYQRNVHGGFLHGSPTQIRLQFCRSSRGPALTVQVFERDEGAEVMLQVESDPERTICGRPDDGQPAGRRGRHEIPLPMLPAPRGATIGRSSQGGSVGQYISQVDMTCHLDLAGMVQYFSEPLQESGWRETRSGRTGPVAWSTWSCRNETGEPVEGTFLAIEQSDHRYTLQVERDIAPGSRQQEEREQREYARRSAQQAKPQPARIETEDRGTAAALFELLFRLVARPEPGESQLLVGELPDDLILHLPLPPRTRLLGSLAREKQITVYLDGEAQPREIEDFYRTRFPPAGWAVQDETRWQGGFAARPREDGFNYLFCPLDEGMAVKVNAYATPTGSASTIHAFPDPESSPCRNPWHRPTGDRQNRQPTLPSLPAPPNTDLHGGGGGGGPDSWESTGYLFGAPGPSEVPAWYGQQFRSDGWVETDHGQDEIAAWSRWRKGTESALFLAVRWPSTNVYHLIARATRLSESTESPNE